MAGFSALSIIDSTTREVFLNPALLFDVEVAYDLCRMRFFNPARLSAVMDVPLEEFYARETAILVNGEPLVADNETVYTVRSSDRDECLFNVFATALSDLELDWSCEFVRVGDNDTDGDTDGDNVVASFAGKVFVSRSVVPNHTEILKSAANCLTDTNSSFQLLRTNPKLSGNIKLVVTSAQELYLDTFKVSDNLNKYAYRHKSVSAQSVYSTDVRNIFRSLDSTDLYKVPDTDLKAHTPYTDYSQQYQTMYEYGVETNDDELYSDNFKMLAPLWLSTKLPDFFAIFRVDGPRGEKDARTDTETFREDFLKNGTCVKVFDMRSSSPLGKYLRNYHSKIGSVPGSVRLQFKEQETGNDYDNGINSWYGISLESGLFAKKDEYSYFANEVIKGNVQDKLDQFIVEGFQRNRLLCPNLINIEFMFNDDGVENYSMNRYFGLYLKENDIVGYDYVEESIDPKTNNYRLAKYDSDHRIVDDSEVLTLLDSDLYRDRLFFAVGSDKCERLTSSDDLGRFLRENVTSRPYRNYQTCRGLRRTSDYSGFMTLCFNRQIRYGEHFRIVVPDLSAEGVYAPVVFEFIASNDIRLADQKDGVSPFVSVSSMSEGFDGYVYYRQKRDTPIQSNPGPGQEYYYRGINDPSSGVVETIDENGFPIVKVVKALNPRNTRIYDLLVNRKVSRDPSTLAVIEVEGEEKARNYPYVIRLNFYTQDIADSSQPADLGTQLSRLSSAIMAVVEEFGLGFDVISRTDSALSILSDYDDTYFQHITADILDNDLVEIRSARTAAPYDAANVEDPEAEIRFIDIKYDGVDQESRQKDPTITYFGDEGLDIPLTPLCNRTDEFEGDFALMFAPVNFELLGWRKTSIVGFLSLKGFSYEIETDDVSKLVPNTIVRGLDGKYVRLNDYIVKSVRILHADDVSADTETDGETYSRRREFLIREIAALRQQLEDELNGEHRKSVIADLENRIDSARDEMSRIESFSDSLVVFKKSSLKDGYVVETGETNHIRSPFDPGKWLVNADTDIDFDAGCISLYTPQPAAVALMGILPIKDFDSDIFRSADAEPVAVTAPRSVSFGAGTTVAIDGEGQCLRRNVPYKLTKGKFSNTPMLAGTTFVIVGDVIYYNSGVRNDSFKTAALEGSLIAGPKGATVSVAPPKIDIDFSVSPLQFLEQYCFRNDDLSDNLKYSLVSPTVCHWKGTGGYYDHDSLLRLDGGILNPEHKKVSTGYMCVCDNRALGGGQGMGITRSLDSLVGVADASGNVTEMDFLGYMTTTPITDSINLFLTDGSMPEYTVGYYNKYLDTLEFILYGVKFSLRFNTAHYVNGIQLSNYNKYEIFIVNDFTGAKNDVVINTIENTILIVNHNFDFGRIDGSDNTLVARGGKVIANDSYDWCPTDKYLNLGSAESDGANVYIPVAAETSLSADITCDKVYQLNIFDSSEFEYIPKETNAVFCADASSFKDCEFIDSFDGGQGYLRIPSDLKVMTNFVEAEVRTVKPTDFGFGSRSVSSHRTWLVNPVRNVGDYIASDDYASMLDDFRSSFRDDDMVIYIKTQSGGGVNTQRIETNKDFRPLTIETSVPSNVKYNVDFYNPNFRPVVDFEIDETEDIITRTRMSCVLANTRVKSLSRLGKSYGFKVFESMRANLAAASNMFVRDGRSLVSSNWDDGYYRKYDVSDVERFEEVDGYVPGIEDKALFGSKAVRLRNAKVSIERWGAGEVTVTESPTADFSTESGNATLSSQLTISVNLTQVFSNHFMTLDGFTVFKGNWKGLAESDDDGKAPLNNFIKNSLVRYFKIGSKGTFKLWSMSRIGSETVLLELPHELPSDFAQVRNFTSAYRKENGEIILDIKLTDNTKSYYMTYEFNSNL